MAILGKPAIGMLYLEALHGIVQTLCTEIGTKYMIDKAFLAFTFHYQNQSFHNNVGWPSIILFVHNSPNE